MGKTIGISDLVVFVISPWVCSNSDYNASYNASCPKANSYGSAPLFKTHFSPLIHFKFNFQNNQLNTP